MFLEIQLEAQFTNSNLKNKHATCMIPEEEGRQKTTDWQEDFSFQSNTQ